MKESASILAALVGLSALVFIAPVQAGAVSDRVKSGASVRVCIWPDYYGISYRNPRNQQLSGIDIDMSVEMGRDLGKKIEYVDTSFARFVDDLQQDRCDVAMMAVGITPQRRQVLRFTRATLRGDIYAITTKSNRTVARWEDIDRPGVAVAVQAGTFMEPVMAEKLRHAKLVVVKPPATREQELETGRVDVFMTDYPYSRRMLDTADWAKLVSPPKTFHAVDYAYAVKPGDEEWLRSMDAFVAKVRKDGRLEASARRHKLQDILVRD